MIREERMVLRGERREVRGRGEKRGVRRKGAERREKGGRRGETWARVVGRTRPTRLELALGCLSA